MIFLCHTPTQRPGAEYGVTDARAGFLATQRAGFLKIRPLPSTSKNEPLHTVGFASLGLRSRIDSITLNMEGVAGSFRGLANAALRVRSFREQLDVNRNTNNVVNMKIPSLLRRGSNFVSHDFVKKTAIGIMLRDSNFLASKLTKGCKRVLKKPADDRADRDIEFLQRKLLRYKFFAQFDESVRQVLL